MLSFKLGFRNIIGAGLRTWLNVIVLSFSFVVIIWHKGFLDGWDQQARHDTIEWEIGGGQYWHLNFDPYDPFTLEKSHGILQDKIKKEVFEGKLAPILFSQATIYPHGRMLSLLIKGISPDQKILKIPTTKLNVETEEIPALVGSRFASNTQLTIGDLVTLRWRDASGTFDAAEVTIVDIFKSTVPTIDNNQIWIPLERLREMKQMPGEATIIAAAQNYIPQENLSYWTFMNHSKLLVEFDKIIKQKTVGGVIIYIILLSLAMLAIFDTQVLSIFRRQKEIGTHMALGMTRGQVVRLFTLEGSMHAVLAVGVAAIYGIPFLYFQAVHGFAMPLASGEYGLAIAERIFPVYGLGLILGTILLVFLTATIVSFLPARKIAKMKPTDAIRGKIQ